MTEPVRTRRARGGADGASKTAKASAATSSANKTATSAANKNKRGRQSSAVNAAHFAAAARAPKLFRALDRQAREEALSECTSRRYAKGEFIIREGARAGGLYFIAAGRAQATKSSACGSKVNFADLERCDHFGEQSLIDGKPHLMTVTAMTDAQIIEMPRPVFRRLSKRYPALVYRLLAQSLVTQRDLSERVLEL